VRWQIPTLRLGDRASTRLLHVKLSILVTANDLSEGGLGPPCSAGSWCRLLHHLVDLFERKTLGLWNEEVGVDEGNGTKSSPYEEDVGLQVSFIFTNHVWCDNGDDGVPEPVGGCGEGNTTRSDWKRENFADNDPGTRTPGRCEEEDEDGNEGDLSVDSRNIISKGVSICVKMSVVETDSVTDDTDQKLADQHAGSANDEDSSATESLNSVEGDGCRADIDQVEDE